MDKVKMSDVGCRKSKKAHTTIGVHQGGASTPKRGENLYEASSRPRSIFAKNAYKGQEEMVGFALIIIIVAIILLVFLSMSLRNTERETVESYEIESFIQAFLQHTSKCRRADNLDFLSVQRLIFSCDKGDSCLNGQDTCDALGETIVELMDESWEFGPDRPIKGRKLEILSDNGIELKTLSIIDDGETTSNSKGSVQEFFRSSSEISVSFVVYY